MSDNTQTQTQTVTAAGRQFAVNGPGLASLVVAFGVHLKRVPDIRKRTEALMFDGLSGDALEEAVERLRLELDNEFQTYAIHSAEYWQALRTFPPGVNVGRLLGNELVDCNAKALAGMLVGNRNETGARKALATVIRAAMK